MSHARVEEVSDSSSESDSGSDPDIMDPTALIVPTNRSAPPPAQRQAAAPQFQPTLTSRPSQQSQLNAAELKTWACVYPLYFDASRSRAEGRRVSSELAAQNPLATNVLEAVAVLGLVARLEPDKMHPKDWGNPGRVRVDLKGSNSGGRRPVKVENSKWDIFTYVLINVRKRQELTVYPEHHLYNLIAAHLKQHPTKPTDPLKLPIHGLPMPKDGEGPPAPVLPRGWKINSILPLHSPAISGGGVSENFFQDVMAEMEGREPGPSSSKKEKVKKIKGKKK
jgi:signal recognition particle subunit SRP19